MFYATHAEAAIHAHVARAMSEWSGFGLASVDPGLLLVEANIEFFRYFGGSARERRGEYLLDLVHPGARERIRRRFDALTGSRRRHFTDRVDGLGARGTVFSGTLTGLATHGADGGISAILVVVQPDPTDSRL